MLPFLYAAQKCYESVKNLAVFMTSLAMAQANNDARSIHSAVMSSNMNRRPQYANVKLQCLNRIN